MSDTSKPAKAAAEQLARTIATTGAAGEKLSAEQQRSVDAHSRSLAEQLTKDNVTAAASQEQAAGGYVRAGEKTTGVDPVEGDALAVEPIAPTAIAAAEQKSDLQRQGEAENARTLEQQRKAAAKAAPKSTRTQ